MSPLILSLNIGAMAISGLSAWLFANSKWKLGFWVSLASQPIWFALGWLTGAWANCLFSIFMLVCNTHGLVKLKGK